MWITAKSPLDMFPIVWLDMQGGTMLETLVTIIVGTVLLGFAIWHTMPSSKSQEVVTNKTPEEKLDEGAPETSSVFNLWKD